jgi:signal transduction histidine kinase
MASQTETNARSRRALACGIGLALVVLAAALGWSMLNLRQNIREQIANRDGEELDAVAAMQHLDDVTSDETIAPLTDPGEQMQLVLKISRLRHVLGVRLFSARGEFVNAFPAFITEGSLAEETLARLRSLKPVSYYRPNARLAEHDLLAVSDGPPVALLEVNTPLHEERDGHLAGVAQFLLNGSDIKAEYARLDRRLAAEALLAFLVGGGVLAGGLGFAFRRLQRTNRLLAQRTAGLLQANRELALAAKTSAVGAVASHLIHGLKNPLIGLQSFVQSRAAAPDNGQDEDWQLAAATAERMNTLISEVVRVLQQDAATCAYDVSVSEMVEMLLARVQRAASQRGVVMKAVPKAAGTLTNREADLVLLILENLVQNAIDATPAGKMVWFEVEQRDDKLIMRVRDEGPGLPPGREASLFAPGTSSKKGGTGIGLAISQQLARHLGAVLELEGSSPQGCSFRLTLPLRPGEQHLEPEVSAPPVPKAVPAAPNAA